MVYQNWVKNMQAAAYNGARTVVYPVYLIQMIQDMFLAVLE
jgi:hypothetical protein